MTYAIGVYDCAGEFETSYASDLTTAIHMVRTVRGLYPAKVVRVTNPDNCDYDSDGLTEDEREMFDDAVASPFVPTPSFVERLAGLWVRS